MSFVGANCLLTLPSSKTQASIEEGTIMDIILINGIENIYDAPLFNRLLIQVNLYSHIAIDKFTLL